MEPSSIGALPPSRAATEFGATTCKVYSNTQSLPHTAGKGGQQMRLTTYFSGKLTSENKWLLLILIHADRAALPLNPFVRDICYTFLSCLPALW